MMRKFLAGGVALGLAACPLSAAAQDVDGVVRAALDVPVVILGEVHDNPHHHRIQAEIVARLSPSAIVFEMLDAREAALLTPASVSDAEGLAALLAWDQSGWPDLAFYLPLFQAAGQIAAYGAEVSRADAQAAFGSSAAEVFGLEAARFGLDVPLPDAQQTRREAGQMAAHCDALPPDILPGFVEAQRLRDAALAQAILLAIGDTGGPVVVITGNGHARTDWGVPHLLQLAAPGLEVFALGQVEGEVAPGLPYDMVLASDPVARPDPCAAFR